MSKLKILIGKEQIHEGDIGEPLDLNEEVLTSKITNVRREGGSIVFDTWRGEFTISPFDETAFTVFSEYDKSGEMVKLKFK